MRKEYTKYIRQPLDENMQAVGEPEVIIVQGLWADTGKRIRNKVNGLLSSGVEFTIGPDSEENYEEVDDPNYVEVIQAIEAEVSGNV